MSTAKDKEGVRPQGNQPNQGPAPDPARSVNLNPGKTHMVDPGDLRPAGASQPGGPSAEPHQQYPGTSDPPEQPQATPQEQPQTPSPDVQTAPPPQDTRLASELSEMKQKYGEALQHIGQLNKNYKSLERKFEEASLQSQISSPGNGAPPQPQTPTEPSGYDPNKEVTQGELRQIMSTIPQQVQAMAIRATWDIQPHEIQIAQMRYPGLSNLPEPRQTEMIRQTVYHLRREAAEAQQPPQPTDSSATPASANQATPSGNVRKAEPSVPLREGGTPPSVSDVQPQNDALRRAQAEYEQAKQIKDKTQRWRAMKEAWSKVLQLSGGTHEQLSRSSFTS